MQARYRFFHGFTFVAATSVFREKSFFTDFFDAGVDSDGVNFELCAVYVEIKIGGLDERVGRCLTIAGVSLPFDFALFVNFIPAVHTTN